MVTEHLEHVWVTRNYLAWVAAAKEKGVLKKYFLKARWRDNKEKKGNERLPKIGITGKKKKKEKHLFVNI